MEQLKDIIEETIQQIEETTALFYQQKAQEGYSRLDTTLNRLMQTVNMIIEFQTDSGVKLIDETYLNTGLTEAMKAMEQKDMILFSDLLIYEVNQVLRDCLERME